MTDKLVNTHHAEMEHILLLVITVGSKKLAIGREDLEYMLIQYNQ